MLFDPYTIRRAARQEQRAQEPALGALGVLVVLAQGVLHTLEAVLAVVGRLASLDDLLFARLFACDGLASAP
jgi:hypothetical protein